MSPTDEHKQSGVSHAECDNESTDDDLPRYGRHIGCLVSCFRAFMPMPPVCMCGAVRACVWWWWWYVCGGGVCFVSVLCVCVCVRMCVCVGERVCVRESTVVVVVVALLVLFRKSLEQLIIKLVSFLNS